MRGTRKFLHGLEESRVPVSVQIHLVVVEAGARKRPVRLLFTSEKTARQGIVNTGKNAESAAHGQVFLLQTPAQQVIQRLRHYRRSVPSAGGDPLRFSHLPRG